LEEKRGGRRKRWAWTNSKKNEDSGDESSEISEPESRLKAEEGEKKIKNNKRGHRDSEWNINDLGSSDEEKTSIVS
jgi:hypothetical protein